MASGGVNTVYQLTTLSASNSSASAPQHATSSVATSGATQPPAPSRIASATQNACPSAAQSQPAQAASSRKTRALTGLLANPWCSRMGKVIGAMLALLGIIWALYSGVLSLRYSALQSCASLYSIGKYTAYCNRTIDRGVAPPPKTKRDLLDISTAAAFGWLAFETPLRVSVTVIVTCAAGILALVYTRPRAQPFAVAISAARTQAGLSGGHHEQRSIGQPCEISRNAALDQRWEKRRWYADDTPIVVAGEISSQLVQRHGGPTFDTRGSDEADLAAPFSCSPEVERDDIDWQRASTSPYMHHNTGRDSNDQYGLENITIPEGEWLVNSESSDSASETLPEVRISDDHGVKVRDDDATVDSRLDGELQQEVEGSASALDRWSQRRLQRLNTEQGFREQRNRLDLREGAIRHQNQGKESSIKFDMPHSPYGTSISDSADYYQERHPKVRRPSLHDIDSSIEAASDRRGRLPQARPSLGREPAEAVVDHSVQRTLKSRVPGFARKAWDRTGWSRKKDSSDGAKLQHGEAKTIYPESAWLYDPAPSVPREIGDHRHAIETEH